MKMKRREMKLIFICAPLRAETQYKQELNRRKAEAIALKYWKKGYAVFCPHKNSSYFGGEVRETTFIKGNNLILKSCFGIVVVGKNISKGMKREIKEAEKLNLKFFYEK